MKSTQQNQYYEAVKRIKSTYDIITSEAQFSYVKYKDASKIENNKRLREVADLQFIKENS